MVNPWMALPGLERARTLVAESWSRAEQGRLDPERVSAPLRLDGDVLRAYRDSHPLASAMPAIRRLLVDDAEGDSGILVAVGDSRGRLLWVEGDAALKSRAEHMLFVEGADWSEQAVGTSAPGTALALDHGLQIHAGEHFAHRVQQWSCTAVPIHDLQTGAVLGVLDITGGAEAVGPRTLSLVEATAEVVEREILLTRLLAAPPPRRRRRAATAQPATPRLRILGRDTGRLDVGGTSVELSTRHAEILALLSRHPEGLSAEALADAVYGTDAAPVTLRAEMVRLRKRLASVAPDLIPLTRPYRLPTPLATDAHDLLALLDRGAHRAALAAAAPVLPGSSAPGIEEIRAEHRQRLRESLLECASVDILISYAQTPEGANDAEILSTALQLLPRRSPRRAALVTQLAALES